MILVSMNSATGVEGERKRNICLNSAIHIFLMKYMRNLENLAGSPAVPVTVFPMCIS